MRGISIKAAAAPSCERTIGALSLSPRLPSPFLPHLLRLRFLTPSHGSSSVLVRSRVLRTPFFLSLEPVLFDKAIIQLLHLRGPVGFAFSEECTRYGCVHGVLFQWGKIGLSLLESWLSCYMMEKFTTRLRLCCRWELWNLFLRMNFV